MSQTNDPWSEDRLGRLVREGLGPTRSAVPDAVVWDRIAAEIEPPTGRLQSIAGRLDSLGASWLGVDGSSGWRGDSHMWVSLRGATVLSLLIVAGFAISGIGTGSGPSALSGRWRITSTRGNPHGLAKAELAIQHEIVPRAIDLTLPSGALAGGSQSSERFASGLRLRFPPPREAYNRSTWLRQAPVPRSGLVTPLEFLNGQ